jgi:hypothetical protein
MFLNLTGRIKEALPASSVTSYYTLARCWLAEVLLTAHIMFALNYLSDSSYRSRYYDLAVFSRTLAVAQLFHDA